MLDNQRWACYHECVLNDTNLHEGGNRMDADLFDYEMKKKGYRTPKEKADALGLSLSAYYRRVSNAIECTREDIAATADILGWDVTQRIFFG